ncbi:TPA: helix-turn-helix transcriptional regulator [Candidatus Galligastranaerophilus gallistercoris]|nr:helix-turn-helix transcriptional regulator [Candidatus Galligastranaerophilus gallistercoris]
MTIKEKDCLKEVESFDKTGFNYTLSLVSGKYKLTVLYAIYRHKIIRFNKLQKYLNMVSHKTLSGVLKELEKDNLIIRKEYPQIPPKVEYSLSKRGESFIPVLYALCEWGENNKEP